MGHFCHSVTPNCRAETPCYLINPQQPETQTARPETSTARQGPGWRKRNILLNVAEMF